jgi:hypothetical protein
LVSSEYPFGIFWIPLLHLLNTPLLSSEYPFGLITPLISFNFSVTKIDSRYVEIQLNGMRECLSVPSLVCFCFLWVSVGSTVGLLIFSMSVCRFHRCFVFVFYLLLPLLPTVKTIKSYENKKRLKITKGYSEDTKGVFRRYQLWCPLRFPCKNDVRFVLTPTCFIGVHVLFMLFVFIYT